MKVARTSVQPAERHGEIAAALRARVVGGDYQPGQRLPTRRELARRYRTTLATMQKVFDRLLADGFVATHNRHGTVVVDRPPHLFHYALVLEAGPEWSRYRQALCGEAERLTAAGPVWFSVYRDIGEHASGPGQERLMADIAARRLAGCILDTHPGFLRDNPLLQASVPKVALVHDSGRPDIPAVRTDHDSWLAQAFGWLRQRGRRRIAWLGIPTFGPARNSGFHQAAQAAGFATRDGWTLAVHPVHADWAANAMAAIFGPTASERPDALLITDDHLAEAATGALARLDLRIPQDLDVVCLNNLPLPLTTHVPVRQLGFDARRTLQTCLDVLARLRAGEPVPAVVPLDAEFADSASGRSAPARIHSTASSAESRRRRPHSPLSERKSAP